MLKHRIIPTLLLKDNTLLKGVNFNSWRTVGSALPAIKVYNLREVDELILLDVSATLDCRRPDFEAISELASECFVPFTVGGGIKSIEDIKELLRSGADKVCINSSIYSNPDFIIEAVNYFGSQCIVASIDVMRNNSLGYECYSYSGTKSTGISIYNWITEVERLGVGEILITSIDYDGTMQGYDFELFSSISSTVNVPIIAAGGAGNYQHFVDAINKCNVSAVAAASMFHFTEQTPLKAKYYMQKNGVPVRILR